MTPASSGPRGTRPRLSRGTVASTEARGEAMRRAHHGLPPLARRFGLSLIVQFGSTVAARARADSDPDVAVVATRPRSRRTLEWHGRLEGALERLLRPGREMDLVVLNGADPLLLFQVASQGRPLWVAGPSTWAEFCSCALRAPHVQPDHQPSVLVYLPSTRRQTAVQAQHLGFQGDGDANLSGSRHGREHRTRRPERQYFVPSTANA